MQVKGQVKALTEVQSGTSQAGKEWQKMQVIITVAGEYPKDVALTVFGTDKVTAAKDLKVGEEITADIDLSSREYNGKWYNDISMWKFTKDASVAATVPTPEVTDAKGDLPF